VKDRIGNTLAKGDKVVLQLPDPMVFGYVAEVQEPNHLVRVTRPGHILVTAVIALPAAGGTEDTILQVAKVVDPDKASEGSQGTSEPPKPN
jgi:hypothetical protein